MHDRVSQDLHLGLGGLGRLKVCTAVLWLGTEKRSRAHQAEVLFLPSFLPTGALTRAGKPKAKTKRVLNLRRDGEQNSPFPQKKGKVPK